MKKITRFLLSAAILGGVALSSCEKEKIVTEVISTIDTVVVKEPCTDPVPVEGKEIAIKDADLIGGTEYTWEAKNTYVLEGLVYLEEGSKLTIEPGTVVKFKAAPSTGDNTSALIIARGAKIMAEGTKEAPIVFTSSIDDLSGTIPHTTTGLWGGLIVLGKAPVEKKGATEINVEGIDSKESRGTYGGTIADDNSGVLKYVSVRYTGVGIAPGDEIQGLTLGGVGSGTTIEYIDIFSSGDDGVEIFGGTVNINHISVAFATDDDFDFDLGYRGNIQFAFSIQDDKSYDHGGEWDGASPDDATLYSKVNFYNATLIGPGTDVDASEKAKRAVVMRDAFTGVLANSILVDFPNKGIEVEDLPAAKGVDSYERFKSGEIKVLNNTWSAIKNTTDVASIVKVTSDAEHADAKALVDHVTANANVVETESVLGGVSRATDGGLDPVPTKGSDNAVAEVPAGIEKVDYRGAFKPGAENWLKGWSTLDKFGYLK